MSPARSPFRVSSLGSPLALVLAALMVPAAAGAQSQLTREDLARLYPGANLDQLSAAELNICLRSSQHSKLKAALDAAGTAGASSAVEAAGPADSPAAPQSDPGFEDLSAARPRAAATLTDAELTECFGPDRFGRMSAARRDRWRAHATLIKFHGFYKSGRMTLSGLQDMANNLLLSEKPPLVTKAGLPLRKQLPLEGKHFRLGLSLSTGWAYIEKDRAKNQRDQQIANVWAALNDEERDSQIADELAMLFFLNKGKKIQIILNLKMLHRGQIGTFDSFKVISLGLDNPWLSPNQNQAYLRSVICHELGHFLQDLLYGRKPTVGPIARFAGLRHNPEVTTNEQIALSEGWGDFCGVTYGKSDYWDWQEGYRHEGYEERNPLKSRSDLLRTEGVVTRTLLLANESIPNFRLLVMNTFAKYKPGSMTDLVTGFSKDYPSEAPKLQAALEETLKGSK